MSAQSDRYREQATAEALDAVRATARAEGREPTVAEFTAAINSVPAAPKRKRQKLQDQQPKEPVDERPEDFGFWLEQEHDFYLEQIREAPGGFDPAFLAQKAIEGEHFTQDDCRKGIERRQEEIALIESVLAEANPENRSLSSLALVLPSNLHGAILSEIDLVFPTETTPEQWEQIGYELIRLGNATSWWWASWWIFGEHKWGDRKKIVEREDWSGPSYKTLANAASVYRVFPTKSSRQRELSFKHHAEVSGIDDLSVRQSLLDWCAEPFKKGTGKPRTICLLREELVRRGLRPVKSLAVEGSGQDDASNEPQQVGHLAGALCDRTGIYPYRNDAN
jgi:hypothetical protein